MPHELLHNAPAAVAPDAAVVAEMDHIALNFDQYQTVYSEWVAGRLSSDEVVRQHGRPVLELIEGQWALSADDTLAVEARVQTLAPVPLTAVDVASTGPDLQEDSQSDVLTVPCAPGSSSTSCLSSVFPLQKPVTEEAWQTLFLWWKAGTVGDDRVRAQLGEDAVVEHYRRMRAYLNRDLARRPWTM